MRVHGQQEYVCVVGCCSSYARQGLCVQGEVGRESMVVGPGDSLCTGDRRVRVAAHEVANDAAGRYHGTILVCVRTRVRTMVPPWYVCSRLMTMAIPLPWHSGIPQDFGVVLEYVPGYGIATNDLFRLAKLVVVQ